MLASKMAIAVILTGLVPCAMAGSAEVKTRLAGVQGFSDTDEMHCLDDNNLVTASQVAEAIGTNMDNYIGFGLSARSIGYFPQHSQSPLKRLLQTRTSTVTCTPLCLVMPGKRPVDWRMCITDHGDEVCRWDDGVFAGKKAAVRGFSMAASSTGLSQVACATGKNWEAGGSTQYTLRATW